MSLRNRLAASFLFLLAVALSACGAPRSSSSSPSASGASDLSGNGEPLDWNVRPARHNLSGHPLRVRYLAYRSGMALELVNESHSDPHQLYSKKVPLEQAATKVQSDEVMDALSVRLRENGLFERATNGPAPTLKQASSSQSFEIEDETGVRHWTLAQSSSQKERTDFASCFKDFYELYNATMQMQAVEQAPEWKGSSKSVAPPRRTGSGGVK